MSLFRNFSVPPSRRHTLTLGTLVLGSLQLLPSAPLMAQADKAEAKKEEKADELPLKSTSKVEYTTDEGTWMSVDISPDGRTIVFDLVGDIYTIPVSGGPATKIVGGMGFDSQPRWSPNGKQIVFVSDRSGAENLWICNADGSSPKALTSGRNGSYISPSWTADGEYILAGKSAPGSAGRQIWMYHKDGGTGLALGAPAGPPTPGSKPANKMGPVASPDGKFVYYAQRSGAWDYNAQFPAWQIFRFNRETSEAAAITNAPGSAMRPVVSPDGKQMVYATRLDTKTALRIRDLDTNEERWLASDVTRDDQESVASRDTMPGYCFTPDGKELILCLGGKIQRMSVDSGKATVIPFTANVAVDIAPRLHFDYRVDDSPTIKARLIRWPSLSPDGKRLAFSSLNKIYVMDLPTGKPRRLTSADSKTGEFMPSWSPDGSAIVFSTWSTGGGQIMRAPADGGAPAQPLTRRAAYYTEPVYTPDGSRIVFITGPSAGHLETYRKPSDVREIFDEDVHEQPAEITGIGDEEPMEIRWIPAQGGGDATLVASAQGGSGLHFANDSNRVYMTTGEGLTSIRLDGLDRRTHIKFSGTGPGARQPGASEVHVSPDGQRAFLDLQNRHYLVQIPRSGKETLNISVAGGASIPVKKMSIEGGDYLGWSPDSKSVTWAWGNNFYKQDILADKPHVTEVTVEAQRAKPKGSVILSGAKIVTMKGDEIIEDGDILITDNRIVAVGPKGKVAKPKDAKVISVRGKTITPGYVDVHSHMWPPRGLNQTQVWQYMANLAYGVTTTRDPQSSTTDVFNYTDLVDAGEILGPRIYTTGPGVFSNAGLDDKDAVRNYIKRYKEGYKTTTLKQYISGDRIVRQWVAMACKEFGITPTTEGALDMKLDLSQMMDGFSGSEHALPIQPLYKDMAQFVAKSNTFYTPTLLVAYGAPFSENYYFENTDVHGNTKLRRFLPHAVLDTMVRRRAQWFLPEEYGYAGIAKGCADIVRAGGRVCLGSHGQMQGLGAHWEIWSLAAGGMTPHETLRCVTLFGAEAIGLAQDLGSLEPGKLADLIVYDKDPLKDIHNTNTIHYVMKNGEMYEGDTLDQVWPVEKKLEKQYWWDADPK